MPKALVTGLTGQDGSYLAELLVEKEYEVHAVVRRSANGIRRKDNCGDLVTIHEGDLTDHSFVDALIAENEFDEIYNLAAQSFVHYSFQNPTYTHEINAHAVVAMLDSIEKYSRETKFYQASTSEMFGGHPSTDPQSEETPFVPQSPYGIAKLSAHHHVRLARDRGIFACAGILFNHESPRRGEEFVTRKITRAITRIHYGIQKELKLGNLDPRRDWGFAGDFVKAMWLMLQQDQPDDYVIGTGETFSIKEFLSSACLAMGWQPDKWQDFVVQDERFKRSNEVKVLRSDPTKAREKLNWRPEVSFDELVSVMVSGDLIIASQEARKAATRNTYEKILG